MVADLRAGKRSLEERLSNITSNHEINSLKLISNVAIEEKAEESRKVDQSELSKSQEEKGYISQMLEDKTVEL